MLRFKYRNKDNPFYGDMSVNRQVLNKKIKAVFYIQKF